MTNTYLFAKRELDVLSASCTDPDDRPLVEEFREEILALCEKFGTSGQSGGSAPYAATAISQTIKHLCLQEPICPITGVEEEWFNCTGMGAVDVDSSGVWQNSRCSGLFRDNSISNGDPYYLDAIVWKDTKGHTWGGRAWLDDSHTVKLSGRQFIQGYPFTPKTFYIDVIDVEVAPDDWEFYIKDVKQLDKVWKYYKKPNTI